VAHTLCPHNRLDNRPHNHPDAQIRPAKQSRHDQKIRHGIPRPHRHALHHHAAPTPEQPPNQPPTQPRRVASYL
jgi:hypothetical protein